MFLLCFFCVPFGFPEAELIRVPSQRTHGIAFVQLEWLWQDLAQLIFDLHQAKAKAAEATGGKGHGGGELGFRVAFYNGKGNPI